MRRALSSLLLVALSFPLIAPMLASDASLPECCRRDGKHHCAQSMGDSSSNGEVSLQAIAERCGSFPKAIAAIDGSFTIPRNSSRVLAVIVIHPAIQFQTEARYRIPFSRSRQKRGPPVFLS